MAAHDVVVIGGSSGGVEALLAVVRGLPADLDASVFVVMHVSPRGRSVLPQILARAGSLPAAHAVDGEEILKRRIYVAPPDFHMVVAGGRLRVVRGPRENNHRPAVDTLFRSAAREYGPRVIGVVLSGALDDGTSGLMTIKRQGGIAVVQDPNDALFPDMPRNASDAVEVDYCVPAANIAQVLVQAVETPAAENVPVLPEDVRKETEIEAMNLEQIEKDDSEKPGVPSAFSCPDCGGVLWEVESGEWLRYRCRVGHGYSAEGLYASQSEALDDALWSAFRALEESAALAKRLAERSRESGHQRSAANFDERARAAEQRAGVIHDLLMRARVAAGLETEESAATSAPD